jgi:iron complex transport system ATP-binding protein
MLDVENLSVRIGDLKIVDNMSFSVIEKQWLMLVGPNGAGKSTIVNAISQGIPYTGSVTFMGSNVARYKPSKLAKNIGVLSQSHNVGFSFTVEEVVRLGRYSYSPSVFSSRSDEDDIKVEDALEITGMLPFRTHSVLTLSGGEIQRTFLAQIFAQDPKLLILDEPTNNLDLIYQKQIFDLIHEWIKSPGRAVISVVHDLSLAKAYGTDAILMNRGRLVSSGEINDVLTRGNLESVYSIDVYQWMKNLLLKWQ